MEIKELIEEIISKETYIDSDYTDYDNLWVDGTEEASEKIIELIKKLVRMMIDYRGGMGNRIDAYDIITMLENNYFPKGILEHNLKVLKKKEEDVINIKIKDKMPFSIDRENYCPNCRNTKFKKKKVYKYCIRRYCTKCGKWKKDETNKLFDDIWMGEDTMKFHWALPTKSIEDRRHEK